MPNIDAPKGLIPVKHLNGAPYNGQHNLYLIPSSDNAAVFIGSPVKLAGTSGAAGVTVSGINCEGMPIVAVAGAGDTLIGAVVGFLPNPDNLSQKHRPAQQARIALVADAPDIIYEVQEDSDTETLDADDAGGNIDLTAESGSATTGVSTVELDSNSNTSDRSTTAQLRLIGLVQRADNAYGTNAKWLAIINEHSYKTATGLAE